MTICGSPGGRGGLGRLQSSLSNASKFQWDVWEAPLLKLSDDTVSIEFWPKYFPLFGRMMPRLGCVFMSGGQGGERGMVGQRSHSKGADTMSTVPYLICVGVQSLAKVQDHFLASFSKAIVSSTVLVLKL